MRNLREKDLMERIYMGLIIREVLNQLKRQRIQIQNFVLFFFTHALFSLSTNRGLFPGFLFQVSTEFNSQKY